MAWRIIRAPLANHIAPTHDIRPHLYTQPCWCWPVVDHPHSENVIHQMFLPDDAEDEEEIDILDQDDETD